MNKLLIVLLMPWCLLISCSEPKNGGGCVTLSEKQTHGGNPASARPHTNKKSGG